MDEKEQQRFETAKQAGYLTAGRDEKVVLTYREWCHRSSRPFVLLTPAAAGRPATIWVGVEPAGYQMSQHCRNHIERVLCEAGVPAVEYTDPIEADLVYNTEIGQHIIADRVDQTIEKIVRLLKDDWESRVPAH